MPNRYAIVGVTSLAALWMYIDRVCFSTLADPVQTDLGLTDRERARALSAFFLTYALFQIPMGSLADRFGARLVLTVSIAAWSLVTAATGFVNGFAALLCVRLLLGVTEAGAYPAAAGLVKNWARPEERGRFSSAVALGGRLGGAAAPYLTGWLAVALVGVGLSRWLSHNPSGVNWRGVLVLYGLCGLAVAGVFWVVVRDRPADAAAPPRAANPPFTQQLKVLARSRNMWLFGVMQLCVNVGWAFVITLLPTYLNKVFAVPLEERGRMQSMVLVVGCCGMFFGGVLTDALRARLGPRRGRTVPLGVALGGCATAMFLIPALASVWAILAALGVMAFLVDLHNPTIWSFAQDVGGRNVGAALGWGNMLGNLGAALSPVLLTEIYTDVGWDAVFFTCGGAFVVAMTCGVMLDATKPVAGE